MTDLPLFEAAKTWYGQWHHPVQILDHPTNSNVTSRVSTENKWALH